MKPISPVRVSIAPDPVHIGADWSCRITGLNAMQFVHLFIGDSQGTTTFFLQANHMGVIENLIWHSYFEGESLVRVEDDSRRQRLLATTTFYVLPPLSIG